MNLPATTNQLSQKARTDIAKMQSGDRGLVFTTFDELYRFGQCIVASKLAPKHYDTPEKAVIGIQWGKEIGLTPMQALKSIAVINGNPAIWGDAIPALCRRHSQFEYIKERWEGAGETRRAIVEGKRRDDPTPCIREFGYTDAKRTGLLSRETYRNWPDRMYQCRARAWMAHDLFPDALMGMDIAEEVLDRDDKDAIEGEIVSGDEAPQDEVEELVQSIEQETVAKEETEGPSALDDPMGYGHSDDGSLSPEEQAELFK